MARPITTATPSRVVGYLRWLFPLLSLLLLGLLMIWPQVERNLALRQAAAPLIDKETAEQAVRENRLTDAVYTDTDAQNRPFEVKAKQAMQSSKQENAVLLTTPSALLKLNLTDTLNGTANTGLYKQNEKILILQDNVVLSKQERTGLTQLSTQSLQMDLSKNTAHTNAPVVITAPDLRIEGVGMLVIDNGDTVYLGAPAKAIWSQK